MAKQIYPRPSSLLVTRRKLLLRVAPKVAHEDLSAVQRGIEKFKALSGATFAVDNQPDDTDLARWIETSKGLRQGRVLFGDVRSDVVMKEQASLGTAAPFLFMHEDLHANPIDPTDWIYAGADLTLIVLSSHRMPKDPARRQIALSLLVTHELGHAYGLCDRNFDIDEGESDAPEDEKIFYARHCGNRTSRCSMQQMDIFKRPSLEEQATIFEKTERWFCASCLEELALRRESLQKHGGTW